MIKSAKHEPLSNFILPPYETTYNIPIYQREYTWGRNQCQELFDDIRDNDDGYFLGSLIWVSEKNEIIDGQQRLTTISLLLTAIYATLPESIEDEELQADKIKIKRMLVNKDSSTRINLQEQNNNREDYTYLVRSILIKKGITPIRPRSFGNRQIGINFRLFEELLKNLSMQDLFSLCEKLCRVTFVSIEVEDYQSAFQLFEAMNNRGVPLSALDLIKNKYISKTSDIKNWEKLIEHLGDYVLQEQFLRNNYNAFRAEYNDISFENLDSLTIKYSIANRAVRSNIISIYDKIIAKDAKSFMQVLLDRSKIYSLFVGNKDAENNEKINKVLKNFRNANATSSYILLLYLYNYKNQFNITNEQLVKLFEFILKFFVRRNFTNNPSTGAIPQILMDIIERINKLHIKNYLSINTIITETLTEKSSSDASLKEILAGNLYENNPDMTRYILCSFAEDETLRTVEQQLIDLWETKNDKYIWTIEHIFPEGKNIPQDWVNMIADGNRELANKYLKEYTHKIGNLTMTGYNSTLGNKSFEEKKNRKDANGFSIGYNNQLILNDYVYKQNSWTIKNIQERTDDLVAKILLKLSLKNA